MTRSLFVAVLCLSATAFAQAPTFERVIDHPFMEVAGEQLYMDIFIPTGKNLLPVYQPGEGGKGLGIVDVVSGEWHANRSKLRDHENARLYHILCARGYTVFAVRPGSRPAFTGLEMIDNLHRAIRYIKANAEQWDIDPERLGITGASAGAHLAAMAALQPAPAQPEAEDPLLRHNTRLKAAALFFPPTDFLNWPNAATLEVAKQLEFLFFEDGVEGKEPEAIRARAERLSPRWQIGDEAPPFLLFHGDRDPVVPLQQSRVFVEALQEHGHQAELIVKEGGAHLWIDIAFDIIKMADWFDEHLR